MRPNSAVTTIAAASLSGTQRRACAQWLGFLVLLSLMIATSWTTADENRGRLIIVGGGLRRENAAIFERLLTYAGGVKAARFVVLPTASNNDRGAKNLRDNLARYGLPPERCDILNVYVANADAATRDEANLELVRRCTGLFMTGGDQTRIIKALVRPDGAETPLLLEIRKLLARGGVIAGSSAGAAVQSTAMIWASGLPDEVADEGFAALDFGLTENLERPGLHVSRGLGFFTGGVIDQHFHQYRGRLGRLVRVTAERRIPFGFGIDENTALIVLGNGACEVVGAGNVTLVDARHATCKDGALGCRISGARVSLLAHGDRWDASRKAVEVHSAKRSVVAGEEASIGGFLIPDINGEGAAPLALTIGLADNSQTRQRAIALKHHDGHSHGYRFTFQKSGDTQAFEGFIDGAYSYSILGVDLKIEPIDGRLRSPEKSLPADVASLPAGATRTALESLWFRGILPVDDSGLLKPQAPLVRSDLAKLLARSVHLLPPRNGRTPSDVDASLDDDDHVSTAEEIVQVVHAGWMNVDGATPDDAGRFHPTRPVTIREARQALAGLARRLGKPAPKLATAGDERAESAEQTVRREVVAVAIYELLW